MDRPILKLLVKSLLLLTVCLGPFLYLSIQYAMVSREYYWKTTHKADHIITGGSRAFRGIAPAVLKEELGLEGAALNIAFNGIDSPYGKYYSRFIKRKLRRKKGDALYILTVHHGLLSDYKEGKGAREASFRVYEQFLVNVHPNLEFVLRNVDKEEASVFSLFLPDNINSIGRKREVLGTKDGWGIRVDRASASGKRKKVVAQTRPAQRELLRSAEREAEFAALVGFLSQRGQVVLVRLPVVKGVRALEQQRAPHFDAFLQKITEDFGVPYLDFSATGEDYTFFDNLHHLDSAGAVKFSRVLAERIREEVLLK